MFPSNNSSTSLNNNNNCIDQQPMFNRPFFINDVSPSSKMYPAPLPIHDQYYSSSFSNTFNSDHHHHHQNSSAADDQDFITAFLQQQQQQHQDFLVGHQFSQIQQQNTTTTTTTSSSISKQTGITTTTTDHQTNFPHLNNMEMISNKNVDDGGGISCREPAAVVSMLWKKKKTASSTTTSKKDRHSKIVTAQGPRDRRMRLSLEIARRFFTLQDMLGFDKASKTVEWLLTKSKGAIKELITTRSSIKGSSNNNNNTTTSTGGGSSTSECEVVSVVVDDDDDDDDDENKVQISNTISSNPKEKRVRVIRKLPTFHHPPLAKDSRAKARARARERTIEKMWSRSTTAPFPHNINQLRANSSSYESTGGEESASQSHDMSLEMVAEVEDHPPAAAARSPSLESQGPIGDEEYSFVINRSNSPTTTSPLFFDYNHHEIKTSQGLNLNNNNNNNCNFPENWDIDSAVEHTLAIIPSQTTCIYQQQIFNLSASHGLHS